MKNIIKSLLTIIVNWMINTKLGKSLFEYVFNIVRESTTPIKHKNVELKITTPNQLCDFRAETFSTKEPETLEWIDSLLENSVLWDIGANVGLYSIYAAKTRNCKVFSFEPSIFNLELLARNIFINNLTEKVSIIPLPLNDKLGISKLKLTTSELGGALSTFDHNIGYDGNKIQKVFEFSVMGITIDYAKAKLDLPQPDYIKMDVDGIEHFILSGGIEVLNSVKGVIIEVNDDFKDQADNCFKLLSSAGLVLQNKKHSDLFEGEDSLFKNCFNQIWIR
ncbi:FkbM family methyltransferase [Aquirufa nivalisilvae]